MKNQNAVDSFNEEFENSFNEQQEALKFAQNVEKFLSQRKNRKFATKRGILEVKKALQETNLPLTSLVFEQEVKRHLNKHKKNELALSPPVFITVADLREGKQSLETQCDLGKDEIRNIRKQYIHSMKELKDELQMLYDKRHQKKLIRIKKAEQKLYLNDF